MSDAGFGTFGPANTMLLDESARFSSHPENVIEVPDWERDETGQILADVGAFVDSLLLATPVDIPKYLDMHQAFPFFVLFVAQRYIASFRFLCSQASVAILATSRRP